MNSPVLKFFIIIAGLIGLVTNASAFKVSPMVQNFDPQGKGATQNFVVENTGDKVLAVQVQGFIRGYDLKGEELRSSTKDLNIYPPQFTLEPTKKRLVRVTYQGSSQLNQEQAYRLMFQQVPVEFQKANQNKKSEPVNINFLLRYVAAIYVVPENVQAKIEVQNISVVKGTELSFVLKNTGSAHQVLSNSKILIKEKGKDKIVHELSEKQIEEQLGAENLLAGMNKRFNFKLNKPLPPNIEWHVEIITPKVP